MPDEIEYIVKLITYWNNIKIPVTLIESKNAIEIPRTNKFFKLILSLSIKFSKTLKIPQNH